MCDVTRSDSDRKTTGRWGECGRFLVAASAKTTPRLAAKRVGQAMESRSLAGVHIGEQALVVEAVGEDASVVVVVVMMAEVAVQTAEVLVDPVISMQSRVGRE